MKESSSIKTLTLFNPQFPYIHKLPCKLLYDLWTSSDQITTPVPVGKLFLKLSHWIHGNMSTYQQHQVFFKTIDNEQISIFVHYMNDLTNTMKEENTKVTKCEKQRRHQEKKKQNKKTNKFTFFPLDITSTNHVDNSWSFNFLFGIYCNPPFPPKTTNTHEGYFAC